MLGIFFVAALGPLQAQSVKQFAQTPLSFEANAGQTDKRVEYLSRGAGYTVFLAPGEAVVRLKTAHGEGDAVRMELEGARAAKGEAEAGQETRTNYLIGSRPENWRTGVANFGRVHYRNVWPGVDVVYYGNQRRLEHDFVVAPGAELSQVRMRLQGAQRIHVDTANGDLVLEMAGGRSVRLEQPVSYQERDGRREAVESRYVLAKNGSVGFGVGSYDRKRSLVIDPVLAYSTYLGGSYADEVNAIAVDSTGAVYVAGSSASVDFPLVNAYQKTNGTAATSSYGLSSYALSPNTTTAFVAKLNPAGTALVWSTYLGGSGVWISDTAVAGDAASGIAVDASGNVYVTGTAYSTDFPLVNAYQKTNKAAANNGTNVFVAKLNAAGSALTWSTYLGGTGFVSNGSNSGYGDIASAIALDASDNVYVTGATHSIDFPMLNAIQAQNLEWAANNGYVSTAFVTKIKASGSALAYSTYLGGSDGGDDTAQAIAVDSAGHAYVGGATGASDFPLVNAIQPANNAYEWGTENGFVAKLNAAGNALLWSTYLGGTGNSNGEGDGVLGLALDSSGNAYVTGYAFSGDFPLVNAYQSKNPAEQFGGANAFVTKFQSDGSAIEWSTYLGGPLAVVTSDDETIGDSGTSIALDKSGNVYVAGFTASANFPLAGALESTNVAANHGQTNAFVSELNASGSALLFSTYWGGEGGAWGGEGGDCVVVAGVCGRALENGGNLLQIAGDAAWALALDGSGNIYVGGTAQSLDFPAYKAIQPGMKAGATENGFVAKFATGTATLAATELTLSSSNSTVIVGTKVTFAARVQELTGTTAPTGTVTFTAGGTAIGTATLNASGYASVSTASLAVGTFQIVASYAGDTKNQSSTGETKQVIEYPAPIFSVAGGTYVTAPKVTITDKSSGVTFYYCVEDGEPYTPTANDLKYAGPLTIPSGGMFYLSAIAIDAKGNASPVTTAEYMTASAPPTITFGSGVVTLAPPSGASGNIYYTTDGTPATTSSNWCSFSCSPTITTTTTTTIHAMFDVAEYCSGYSWCNSTQATAVIVAAPVITSYLFSNLNPGFQISDATGGANISYKTTINGTTSNWVKYSGPVSIGWGTTVVNAVAGKSGDLGSAVTTYTFIVAVPSSVTLPVSHTAAAEAVLNGQVKSATKYWFEYGTSATALTHKTAVVSVKAGSAATSVAQTLAGLTSGQQYFFHLVATNGNATSKGAVLSFTVEYGRQEIERSE
jgi:hypothetical protein